MLTDLIACTNSTYTQTEKGEVTEFKIGSRATVKRVVGSDHSNSKSDSNSNSCSHSNSNNNDSNSHSVVLGLGEEIGEELLLNAIAVCTNITFYACKVLTSVHILTHPLSSKFRNSTSKLLFSNYFLKNSILSFLSFILITFFFFCYT